MLYELAVRRPFRTPPPLFEMVKLLDVTEFAVHTPASFSVQFYWVDRGLISTGRYPMKLQLPYKV